MPFVYLFNFRTHAFLTDFFGMKGFFSLTWTLLLYVLLTLSKLPMFCSSSKSWQICYCMCVCDAESVCFLKKKVKNPYFC
jgi:cytochrome c oxidase subunit IV